MGVITSTGAVDALRARLRGPVLVQGDDGYEQARAVWNARIDRHPAMVARCSDAPDVAACVAFAREHGLALAVKSGGHDFAGNSACDGGLLVDLSAMDAVHVDPDARIARVDGDRLDAGRESETQVYAGPGLAGIGALPQTIAGPGVRHGVHPCVEAIARARSREPRPPQRACQ